MSKLKMLALAGAEEIGMNMSVYLYENDKEKYAILVDCGVGFDSFPGATIAIPNIALLKKLGIQIKALVITHGHEDHIGAIPHLIEELNCPIYATPFTAGLIKRKVEYIHKRIQYEMNIVQLGETRELGPFTIKWFAATHSIPDNSMLGIEVGGLRVLHTGDWKDDNDPLVGLTCDFKGIAEFAKKGVDLLVADSTNIHEEGDSITEYEVGQSLLDLMQKMKLDKTTCKGKFVLTCFSSNIARVKSVIEAARICGRKVLILGSSLKNTTEIAANLGYIKKDIVITEEEACNIPNEELAIITTGSQAEEKSSLWKMANQMRSAGSVLNAGDTLIFSARVIDGRQHDVRKVINQLIERGIRIVHPWNSQDSLIHASGHPPRSDVKKLMNIVKPHYVIPVHCEAEHRHSHIIFARELGYKAFNLRNNTLIEITKEGVKKIESYENCKLVVDGNRLINENSKIFTKRKEMNNGGFVMISVKFMQSKTFSIITNYGLYDEDNDKKTNVFNQEIKKQVDKIIGDVTNEERNSKNYNLKTQIIYSIKKYVKEKINKAPLVGVHFC